MSAPRQGGISGALTAAAAVSAGRGKGGAATVQTALRLVCNCFRHEALRAWVGGNRELLLDGFAGCHAAAAGGTKGIRLSLATLLLNYAVLLAGMQAGDVSEAKMQVLSGLEELLSGLPLEEADAAHRAVVAVGSLAAGDKAMAGLVGDLGVDKAVGRWAAAGGKVGEAVGELLQLLRGA